MASQRARFGSTLVNRARAETLEAQKEHESTEQGKVDAARQKREEERRQKQAAEVGHVHFMERLAADHADSY